MDIASRHPDYMEMIAYWEFYMDSYKGGQYYLNPSSALSATGNEDFRNSYLHPHDSEYKIKDKFNARHRKSFYENWCALPVNTYSKYIFSEGVDREYEENSGYQEYIDNIDLKGNSIDLFMRQLMVNMMVYGVGYILLDKPPLPEGITTLGQQKEIGNRAYASFISPTNLVDWSINTTTGLYQWVLIRSQCVDDGDYSIARATVDRYYLWTPTHTFLLNKEGELYNDTVVQHNLGVIPLIRCTYSDADVDCKPESFLTSIAQTNREIYNIDSMYSEELYKIAFAQLLKQKSPDVLDGVDEIGKRHDTDLSTEVAIEYEAGTNAPAYLAFPVSALVEKRARKDELIQNIMRTANLGNQAGVQTDSFRSGLAMSFAYSDTHATAGQLSQKMEYYENRLWDYIKAFDQRDGLGLINGDIKVTYPTKFNVQSDLEARENFKTINDNIRQSSHLKVLNSMQEVVRVLNPEQEDRVIIEKELIEGYSKEQEATEMEAQLLLDEQSIQNEQLIESQKTLESDETDNTDKSADED